MKLRLVYNATFLVTFMGSAQKTGYVKHEQHPLDYQADSEAKWFAIFIMKQYWDQIKPLLHGVVFLATAVPFSVS